MKVALFSNFFNEHMIDLSDALNSLSESFLFITSTKIMDERIKMGFTDLTSSRKYVVNRETLGVAAIELVIREYDVILTGANSDDIYFKRLKTNKLVFKISVHPFKGKINPLVKLLKRIKWRFFYKNKSNSYLLAMSSRCAHDFKRSAFKNHILNFGYFPPFIKNDIQFIKKDDSFLWVGRMIWWKHAEIAVGVIESLKSDGFDVKLKMVGDGADFKKIKTAIDNKNLSSSIELVGYKKPDEVRLMFDKCKYFLFTSDTNEGWGAVLNEAMNSRCVCFASKYAGSTNTMINGFNGMITDNTIKDISNKIKIVLLNKNLLAESMSEEAYATIELNYNGHIAAERIIEFSKSIIESNDPIDYKTGLLSRQSWK